MSHDAPTVDPDAVHERRVLVVIGGGAVVERDLPNAGAPVRLVIGRALECDVRIDDPAISRTHVVLLVDQALSLVVESRTGRTRVDGREVSPGAAIALEPGQVVEIGQSRLVVRRERIATGGARSAARPMDAARRAIDLAAKSDLPVLLLGETGAGKEVAMERIVAGSRRSGAPVVRIDCATLPGSLDTEPAPFDVARGGTLFLDEIANVPLEVQARLLRVTATAVDVRVMAATNADLRARVADGSFREDLYFRLAGIVVTVPPLRERQDEIAELARSLIVAEATHAKVAAPAIAEGALALLVAYRWPGNVRELRNVVGRALHGVKDVIEVGDLEIAPPDPRAPASTGMPASVTAGTPAYERARIALALEKAKGNQKEAARILGMTRRMLMYRLDAYGLPRPRKR